MKTGILHTGQASQEFREMMQAAFGELSTVIVTGALDGMDEHALAGLAPRATEPQILLNRVDGSPIIARIDDVRSLVQAKLEHLTSQDVDLVVLVCTGQFPGLKAAVPVLIPALILDHLVSSMLPVGSRLGVVVPLEEQVDGARARWGRLGYEASVVSASPFGDPSEFNAAGKTLSQARPRLSILDAFYYARDHRNRLQEHLDGLIVLPQEMVMAMAFQLLS
jgi:protein AroM